MGQFVFGWFLSHILAVCKVSVGWTRRGHALWCAIASQRAQKTAALASCFPDRVAWWLALLPDGKKVVDSMPFLRQISLLSLCLCGGSGSPSIKKKKCPGYVDPQWLGLTLHLALVS